MVRKVSDIKIFNLINAAMKMIFQLDKIKRLLDPHDPMPYCLEEVIGDCSYFNAVILNLQ